MEFKEAKNRHLRSLHVEVYKHETAVAHGHTKDVLFDLDADTAEDDTKKKKGNAKSGTVVEDVFFVAGEKISGVPASIQDTYTQKLFDNCDWEEIKKDIPKTTPYAHSTRQYMETLAKIKSTDELKKSLKTRPDDIEMELVHKCLVSW